MKDETDIARSISVKLDQGLELPEPVLARLRAGRQKALDHQRQSAGALANVGGFNLDWLDARRFSRILAPLALIAVAVFVGNQWTETRIEAEQRAARLAEIDVAMLSSDLPLEAYLDRDFHAWLNAQPQSSSY
ncbi:MAG TPA: DUF3619 family protein [Burkholderiales bacterium]|nr:DUF3619 family protein [Burkholderiales bacterium]